MYVIFKRKEISVERRRKIQESIRYLSPLRSCKLTQRMSADCVKFVVCLLLLPSVVECCFGGGRKKKEKTISKYAYYLYIHVCERS